MGTAKVVDGKAIVAYVNGVAVDSEGAEVKGAPKQPKDTDPSQQPGAMGALTSEQRMGVAIAQALRGDLPARNKTEDDVDETEETDEKLPTLADLQDHLATLETVEEVEALQKTDERVGAVKHYEARLAELKGE